MKCIKCGSEISEGSKFCPICGNPMESMQQSITQEIVSKENGIKKSKARKTLDIIGNIISGVLGLITAIVGIGALTGAFDKKPILCIILFAIIGLFTWLGNRFSKVPMLVFDGIELVLLIIVLSISNNAGIVASVKGGSPDGYPGVTYEEAFEDYFSNPTWKNLGKNEDGNYVVKFTGNCLYMDQTAIAEIKFTIYKDQERFVVSSVKINDQDMGIFGNALVIDVFEEYNESPSSKITNDVSEVINNFENGKVEKDTDEENNEQEETYYAEIVTESAVENTEADLDQEIQEVTSEDLISEFGYNMGQYDNYAMVKEALKEVWDNTQLRSMDQIQDWCSQNGCFSSKDEGLIDDEIALSMFCYYYDEAIQNSLIDYYKNAEAPIGYVVVDAPDGYVNFRNGPGTNYDIICEIYNMTIMPRYYSEYNDWSYVRYDEGKFGYVANSQIRYY